MREKIQWTFIEFPDNKDCIELIDRKPNGIIPTLDEQVCACVRVCVSEGCVAWRFTAQPFRPTSVFRFL